MTVLEYSPAAPALTKRIFAWLRKHPIVVTIAVLMAAAWVGGHYVEYQTRYTGEICRECGRDHFYKATTVAGYTWTSHEKESTGLSDDLDRFITSPHTHQWIVASGAGNFGYLVGGPTLIGCGRISSTAKITRRAIESLPGLADLYSPADVEEIYHLMLDSGSEAAEDQMLQAALDGILFDLLSQ